MAKKKTKKRSPAKVKEGARVKLTPAIKKRLMSMLTEEDVVKFKKKVDSLKEDLPSFFGLQNFGELDPALTGFRKFSENVISTDLDESKQDRQYVTGVVLYHKSPMARYFASLKAAFLSTGKMQVNAADEKVAKWIHAFLTDPFTQYSLFRGNLALESVVGGENLVYPNVNAATGHVRLAYLSPGYIKGPPAPVPGFPHMSDKLRVRREALRLLGVLTAKDKDLGEEELRKKEVLDVIRPRIVEVGGKELVEKLSGDIFFQPYNRLLSSLRGHSQFLSSADQIDAIDEALFAMIERLYLLNLFIWHLSYEGFSESRLRDKRREINRDGGIKGGTFLLTNGKAKIEAVTGNFGNADFVTGFDKALNVAAMSFGIPQAWLGLGDLVNRASAQVSETPILKMLQKGREEFREMEKRFIEYHVLQGKEKGSLAGVEDFTFDISYEELSKSDQGDVATAMSTITGALSVAVTNDWMTKEQAQTLTTFIAEQIVKLPDRPDANQKIADPDQSSGDPDDFAKTDPAENVASDARADAAAEAVGREQVEDIQLSKHRRKKAGAPSY